MTFKQPDILSNAPYYDDFDDAKSFLRTLFKPGYAVQARELTQLQTTLQSQISRFADHIFADGSQVFGGKVSVTGTNYVRVESVLYTNLGDATLSSTEVFLEGRLVESEDETITNSDTYQSNRLTGTLEKLELEIYKLVDDVYSTESSGTILANHYIVSSDNGEDDYPVIFFSDITGNEGISPNDLLKLKNEPTYFKVIDPAIDAANDIYVVSPTGLGTMVRVDAGIYYIDGMFVRNKSQILVPFDVSVEGQAEESYESGNTSYDTEAGVRLFSASSARIGLFLNRSVVTADDDQTLRDPSNGIYNANAPGADRYKISLDITQYPYDPQDIDVGNYANQDFIQIARIVNGRLDWIRRLPNYSEILDLFAKRTHDESGSYTVTPFGLEIKHHLRNDVYVYIVKSAPDAPTSENYIELGSYIWTNIDIGDPRVANYNFDAQEVGIGEIVAVVPYKELAVGIATQTANSTSKLIYVKQKNNKRLSIGSIDSNGFGTIRYARSGVNYNLTSTAVKYQNFIIDKNGTFSVFDNPVGDASLLNIGIQPGKAYVHGYETELSFIKNLEYDKGQDITKNTQSQSVNLNSTGILGNYLVCNFANDPLSSAVPDWETLPKFDLQTSDIFTLVIEETDLTQVSAIITYWSPFKYWSLESTNYMLGLPPAYSEEQHESVIFVENT